MNRIYDFALDYIVISQVWCANICCRIQYNVFAYMYGRRIILGVIALNKASITIFCQINPLKINNSYNLSVKFVPVKKEHSL